MAFGSVTTGSGAANKPWFNFNGQHAQVAFSIASNSAHLSPSTGTMLCLTESITSSASGGSMTLFVANSGGGGYVETAGINPSGTGDTTSARYTVSGTLSKTLVAGTTYWMGLTQTSTTAVGFLRLASGSGQVTYQRTSSWASGGSWDSEAYFKVYYNTVPSQPLSLTATAGTNLGSVDLTWAVPTNQGGVNVDGYKIEWSTSSSFATITGNVADTGTTTTSRTVVGLTPGTTYYFRVAALNPVTTAWGGGASSPYSASASAVARSVGKRFDGSSEVPIVNAMRWDAAQNKEMKITVMKRWNGTAEVDLQG